MARQRAAAPSRLPSCSSARPRKYRALASCGSRATAVVKGLLGLVGHDAVGGGNQGLAEIGVARRSLAVERQRFAPRHDRVVEAAEPQIDRGDHLPAGAVVGTFRQVRFDLADQASIDWSPGRALTRAKAGCPGTFGEPRRDKNTSGNSGSDDQRRDAAARRRRSDCAGFARAAQPPSPARRPRPEDRRETSTRAASASAWPIRPALRSRPISSS